MCVVAELVFADLSNGEITGLGMGKHQTRYTRVGLHGTTLGETDTDLFHIYEIVENEVQTRVWQ